MCVYAFLCGPNTTIRAGAKERINPKQYNRINQPPHNECTKGIWLCKNLSFLSQNCWMLRGSFLCIHPHSWPVSQQLPWQPNTGFLIFIPLLQCDRNRWNLCCFLHLSPALQGEHLAARFPASVSPLLGQHAGAGEL